MPEPVDKSQGDNGRPHKISPKTLWSAVEISRGEDSEPPAGGGLTEDALAAAFAGMSDPLSIDASDTIRTTTPSASDSVPVPDTDSYGDRPTPRRRRLGIAAAIACVLVVIGIAVGLNTLASRDSSEGGESSASSQGETGGSRTSSDSGARVVRETSRQDEGETAGDDAAEDSAKNEEGQQSEGNDEKGTNQGEASADGEKKGESASSEGGNTPASVTAPAASVSQPMPADTGGRGGGESPADNGSYTIVFDASGGSCESQSRQVGNGMAVGALPVARRDYHTFTGWFCNGSEVGSGTVLAPSATHTLIAHWAENSVSDWVMASDAPGDAQVADRKWTYRQTVYKSVPSSYTYYRWCSYYDNTWNQDSCQINNTSCYHEITVSFPLNACPNKFPDKGGNAAGLHGPYSSCGHKREGQSYWWLKRTNYSNVVDRVDSHESSSYPSQNNVSDVTEWVRYRPR